MFQVGEWPCELKICLVKVLKCDFGDVDDAIFHCVEIKFQRFFYILVIKKNVLDEVVEVMF
jgi:hypothetical protein